jgi:ATP-dependent DNA helicase RecG
MEIGMRMRFVVGLGEPIQIEHTGKKDQAQVEAQVEAQVDFQILAACANAPLSSAEISTALGHKQLSGNLRKALPRLRQAELLEFTVPDKPKSRLQKYRITSKGRKLTDNGML